MIEPVQRPRNRLFVWKDPQEKHDLIVFLGEAQPPIGKLTFCKHLIADSQKLGVERVFTFAAMATQMHPEHPSRLFGAAADPESLAELKRLEVTFLHDGTIGGLNGLLIGAAASAGLRGTCLLGEMPHIFSQVPYPKASLSILEAFTSVANLELDLGELADQAKATDRQLGQILARVEQSLGRGEAQEEGYATETESETAPRDIADDERIESLFQTAQRDRSKAFELKQELDRLGRFKEFEDRFLDLFRKASGEQSPGTDPAPGL
jgi:proteasome assembly chaperone (PAC2) family protein